MASRATSFSEGEVHTSDTEKATTKRSKNNNLKVDRSFRPTSSAPRSPYDRSQYSRSRSRSRSPYRASTGEKRARRDSRDEQRKELKGSDTRLDDKHSRKNWRHDRYNERDTRSSSGRHHRHNGQRAGARPYKRARTRSTSRERSRSPYRAPRQVIPIHKGQENEQQAGKAPVNNISQEDKLPTRDSSSVSHINDLPDASLVVSSKIGSSTHVVDSISCGSIITTRAASTNLSTTKTGPMHAVSTDVVGPVSDPLDEKALIEERRKRREAIRAKYQAQPSPMLIQALHVNSEATTSRNTSGSPSTPMHDQSEPSPPWTPNEISAPQSPVELIKDDDMFGNEDDEEVEPNQADHQEAPSAADYDPTADMEEERSRHIQQLQEADVSASTYDETQMNDKAPSLKSIADEENKDPRKNTFDMFAEDDDDDDMFAEAPKQGSRPRSASIKKTAQALDVNMMDNWDDTSGYYITIPGELIDGRYQVTQNLGRGMFASVIRVIDQQTSQEMAVKIVRNNDTMRKAGIKEVDILKDLATNDMDDKKHIVRLIRSFDHKGHLCMVFENLSMNLRELLKKYGRTKGIGMKAIRAYAQQLFLGLSLLKRCQYLHADLKPDNILVNENLSVLKICDLGSASAITEAVTAPYLVSRFYRAPELMLGMPYDYGIDVWSIGCTLFELYTGKILFTGKNNNGMLKAIMQCRGKFPQKILRKGTLTYQHFDEALSFQSIELDKLTGKEVTRVIDIKARPIRDLRSRLMPADGKLEETERKELDLLLDLLDKCLDLRVDKRLTPSDALKHPFILRTTSK